MLRSLNLQKHCYDPLTSSMFVCSRLLVCLCVFSTCVDLQQSQTEQKGKVTRIKVLQSSHAYVVSLSRSD